MSRKNLSPSTLKPPSNLPPRSTVAPAPPPSQPGNADGLMGDRERHRILMVCDFFYPNFGGVESHIYCLSQCLLKLGHKNALPTFYGTLPIMRTILVREKITLHSHEQGLPPEKVYVVPNAVDTAMFTPAPEIPRSNDEIVIVVVSRLVYRKGADLLVEVIPEVCRLYPHVRFVVGGDGPKRVRLEEMREKHFLQDRVEMLGAIPHSRVRSVLISGHIFLNSSLTEAFCIAILEAASCGLLTVSTRVGGVPEVLPDDMVVLAEPDPVDLVRAIKKAITILPTIDPQDMHKRVKKLYDWHDVARRTEIVYDRAMKCPNQNLLERLGRYLSCGSWAGKLFCLVMIIDFLLFRLLQLVQPANDIEEVPDMVMALGEGSSAGDDIPGQSSRRWSTTC
ncbi:phosphatidylinositol N-acetylglucosaminyltransferase subunit A isoform X5 [Eucalyptus grandis]|uniref:phosphatidylinositol N-acetylglucosaminyltransferase subunit A isoform X5 n=1 Tax=Eucalyptus grandis TaxID=71139 RepID=UPI00192F0F06|nr:phosphatidylinositol N-acetylglucosaminyltransferase subunit A isoform X5 [Eucalyptus grandis]